MRNAWSPAREVKFNALEENLFTIQCSCLGNWMKITESRPWLFRQNAVIIEPYDGIVPISSVNLDMIAVWIQIHNLPPAYRKEKLIRNLAERKIGPVDKVEPELEGIGNFVRIRARVNVHKPVTRFVTISRQGEREFYHLKYEKFPKFCGACGQFGHMYTECGTGEHQIAKLKWGDWLRADWETWHGRRNFSGFRGSDAGGRRGGRDSGRRGRGQTPYSDWRLHPERNAATEKESEEMKDTASSPIKPVDSVMTDKEKSAKKRLALEDVDDLSPMECVGNELVAVNNAIKASIGPYNSTNGTDEAKGSEQTKRRKGDSGTSQNQSNSSVGSFDECRREQ